MSAFDVLTTGKQGNWAVKTSTSKPLGMAVNVRGWGIVQSILWARPPANFKKIGLKNFSLSHEDARGLSGLTLSTLQIYLLNDKNDWNSRIKESSVLPGKGMLKQLVFHLTCTLTNCQISGKLHQSTNTSNS